MLQLFLIECEFSNADPQSGRGRDKNAGVRPLIREDKEQVRHTLPSTRDGLGGHGRAAVIDRGLRIPCRRPTLDEPSNVGVPLDAAEERPARGVLPQHDVELLRVVEDVFVVGLRSESGIEIACSIQKSVLVCYDVVELK